MEGFSWVFLKRKRDRERSGQHHHNHLRKKTVGSLPITPRFRFPLRKGKIECASSTFQAIACTSLHEGGDLFSPVKGWQIERGEDLGSNDG